MNLIEVSNLNKYFHSPTIFQVLKNLNFCVEKGKLTTITGKSGSGKSTLLYLIATLDTDFQGSIIINNEEVKGRNNNWLSQFRNQNIGFIFQFHFLLPDFTVLDNIMLPALKLGKYSLEEIEYNAIQILTTLGIEDQALKNASQLSGGQQQRVAIARAMINNPSIIIGDEPTGNLDTYNTSVVIDLFKEIVSNTGQTILIVTHDQDFANESDRVIHMCDGAIIEGNNQF